MRMPIVILGVILLLAGAAIATFYSSHHLLPYAGVGLAVLGVIAAAGGAMMKAPRAFIAGQFKCSSCGKTFNSEASLKAHSKDKHGILASSLL